MSFDARIQKKLKAVAGSPAFDLNVHLGADGGVSVLFGPSGSGKTLTLNCLAGFLRPDAGRILIADRILFDSEAALWIPPEQRRCGYLFQDHALFPHMTVRDNLLFAASVARSKPTRRARHRLVQDLLEAFELGDLANRRARQLSGGQQQRAALARVLASEPAVLLLDEPTRGLDGRLKESFYAALRLARQRLDAPVLLITHDVDECLALADHLFVMQGGRLLQEGSPEEVLSHPITAEVARSFGLFGLLEAEIKTLDPGRGISRILIGDQEVETPYFRAHLIGDRGWLCIRQSEIRIRPMVATRAADEVAARIRTATPSTAGVRLDLSNGLSATVSSSDYDASLSTAAQVYAKIPRSAVCFVTGP